MKSQKKVIVLEFNELSPRLMARFMAAGELPNFKKLYEGSQVFVTDAQEKQEDLEPWIQWVTVHTGLPYKEHGIGELGEADKLQAESLWDVVNKNGGSSFICGSMNAKYSLPFNGAVIPDPWDSQAKAYPESLSSFYNFVRTNVQEHTNKSVPLTKADYCKFLGFMLSNGLSLKTIFAIGKQIVAQLQGKDHWKKAVLLDKLQFDVFRSQYKKMRPTFSTLFLNSTAHYQHKYWRNMEMEPFTIKPDPEEQAKYGNAILFGYQEMDKIVGDVLDMQDADTSIVLLSALGQQPYLGKEEEGGKTFYRPETFETLLDFLEIKDASKVSPVMSEQFHLFFESEDAAIRAAEILEKSTLDGKEIFYVRREGANVFTGCKVFGTIASDAMLHSGANSETAIKFYDIFYQADCVKSGMHHPDGIFWINGANGEHRLHHDKLPLTRVAEMLLQTVDIEAPAQMRDNTGRQVAA